SPLRASRLAVMAANFAELTGGSPEIRRRGLWSAADRCDAQQSAPEGLGSTTIVEALRRFTDHALAVEARTAFDAGGRVRAAPAAQRRIDRLNSLASVEGFGSIGRREAADGKILSL